MKRIFGKIMALGLCVLMALPYANVKADSTRNICRWGPV